MAAILRPFDRLQTRGQIKPQGPFRIDWTHPLAQGLVFYGFDDGSGIIRDLVAGRPMLTVGTRTGNSASGFGTGIAYNANQSSYFKSDAIIRAINNSTTGSPGWSVACAYVQTGTVAQFSRPFGRTANNGASAPFVNWDFEINPSGAGQNVIVSDLDMSSGLSTSAQYTGNSNNTFMSLAMTVSTDLAVNTTIKSYAQGLQWESRSTSTAIPNSNQTNDSIIFSGASDAASSVPFIGFVFYGAHWTRTLSAEEITFLHLNPYDFLIPAEMEMPTLLASAAAAATYRPRRTLVGAGI